MHLPLDHSLGRSPRFSRPSLALELGGHYSVNAQVRVKDNANKVYVSDWWPRLRVH